MTSVDSTNTTPDPGFTHAVIHMAHRSLRPKCDEAAVRIMGLFRDRQQALVHGRAIADRIRDCDVHLLPVGKWTLVPCSREHLGDAEYTLEKIDRIKAEAVETNRRHQEDFEKNREKMKTGEVGMSRRARKCKSGQNAGAKQGLNGGERKKRILRLGILPQEVP